MGDTYEIRVVGQVHAEQLGMPGDCTVRYQEGDSLVTAQLDQAGIARVLRRLDRLGVRLLSLHRVS